MKLPWDQGSTVSERGRRIGAVHKEVTAAVSRVPRQISFKFRRSEKSLFLVLASDRSTRRGSSQCRSSMTSAMWCDATHDGLLLAVAVAAEACGQSPPPKHACPAGGAWPVTLKVAEVAPEGTTTVKDHGASVSGMTAIRTRLHPPARPVQCHGSARRTVRGAEHVVGGHDQRGYIPWPRQNKQVGHERW